MPSAKKQEVNLEEPISLEEAKKYDVLIGKNFIRIDPETKKPWPEAKEFFWKINHHFRSTVNHASGFRLMFQVQKYYRNKTIEVQQRMQDGNSEKVKKHVPFKVMETNVDGQEALSVPGDMLIDAADFVRRFAVDKASTQEQTLMVEASASDAEEAAAI